MDSDNERSYVRIKKRPLFIATLVLAAGLLGWWLGQSDDDPKPNNQTSSTQTDNTPKPADNSNADVPGVKSLISYVLPDGWKEASCPNAAGAVYVVPNGGGNVDCSANPSSPVKISVDGGNNKDCNQLQNVQNVSKHICSSEFINGHKSLKAETRYNQASSYKKDTTIHAYYIDTGKGVIKVEYVYNNDNEYQAGFEQLAKSVKAK